MPPPPSDHGMNALRFLASGKAPFDVRFDLDGEIFEAHRMVVAAQAYFQQFEGLLYGHGREAGKDVLEVGGGAVTAEAFRDVLHFIDTDEIPVEGTKGRGSYDWMVQLFEAADYYLIKDELKLVCVCRLGEFIKDSTVLSKDLPQACQNFAAHKGLRLLPNLENMQSAIKRGLLVSSSSGAVAPATGRIMDVSAPSMSG
ncbi:hypothetical protein ZWY2020_044660 [Hordeum vulgare]|nr:hypothetical protein ZWY2020_044660 [Hordeum vulgare]